MKADEERFEQLRAELIAIEQWDRVYHRQPLHDSTEIAAYKHRQARRKELVAELLEILGIPGSAMSSHDNNGLVS